MFAPPPSLREILQEIVSRETVEKLIIYHRLLTQWNKRFNLIQEKSLEKFWERHVLDSLQLLTYLPALKERGIAPLTIVDMGSGAGFPGMVLALSGFHPVTLCEIKAKKCFFLEEVALHTHTPVSIFQGDSKTLQRGDFQIITSRAYTNLETLLFQMKTVSRETVSARGLFHKTWKIIKEEIIKAQQNWQFDFLIHTSQTSSEGCIVEIYNLTQKIPPQQRKLLLP